MTSENGDDPIYLVMLAGLLRDDFPWMAEIMTEAYHEIREGDPKSSHRAIERLRRLLKNVMRREFLFDFAGPSKDAHMLAMEMPRMLDHFIHRFERRTLDAPDADAESAASMGETPKS